MLLKHPGSEVLTREADSKRGVVTGHMCDNVQARPTPPLLTSFPNRGISLPHAMLLQP